MDISKFDKIMERAVLFALVIIFLSAVVYVAKNSEIVNLIQTTF